MTLLYLSAPWFRASEVEGRSRFAGVTRFLLQTDAADTTGCTYDKAD